MIEHGPVERHDFSIRTLTVSKVAPLGASLVRVTLTGEQLSDFVSTGPADHVKVFFPDPTTGELAAPVMTADGIQRPEHGVVHSRDYTPAAFRAGHGDVAAELDLDFVLHGSHAPAAAWASRAAIGDTLTVGGPRGSRPVPTGITRVVLGGDETALPAIGRWIGMLPAEVEIHAFIELLNDSDAVYLDPETVHRAHVIWLEHGGLERALRNLGPIDETTYVWLAGEAGALVPLRRYLRRELGLPKDQVKVSGYWKRGEAGRDHHAPIDPADPED